MAWGTLEWYGGTMYALESTKMMALHVVTDRLGAGTQNNVGNYVHIVSALVKIK